MRFHISRTTKSPQEQPCDEAYRASYTRVDERSVDTPEKLPVEGETWYQEGKNHRVERGHIMRDFPDEGWFLDVVSLGDLLAFQHKYGDLIIRDAWSNPAEREIEIYDDYRE